MSVTFDLEPDLSVEDYVAVLSNCTLGRKRPLANRARIAEMLAGANLIVTARDTDGVILGLARCLSDGAWVCYCAELAVRDSHQGKGIGRGLMDFAAETLGPRMAIILISEPDAVEFYRKAGFDSVLGFARNRSDRD